jgi:carboxylesterase type B
VNQTTQWIYGGGFQFGSTRDNDGTTVVSRSLQLGEPVIYVAANYRLNGQSHFLISSYFWFPRSTVSQLSVSSVAKRLKQRALEILVFKIVSSHLISFL